MNERTHYKHSSPIGKNLGERSRWDGMGGARVRQRGKGMDLLAAMWGGMMVETWIEVEGEETYTIEHARPRAWTNRLTFFAPCDRVLVGAGPPLYHVDEPFKPYGEDELPICRMEGGGSSPLPLPPLRIALSSPQCATVLAKIDRSPSRMQRRYYLCCLYRATSMRPMGSSEKQFGAAAL
ncbi:hypothetical protein DL93DRAFT_2103099 [Clavulina sp. PMI_390]|nr:hypothetical protein DL93DRAFT_2103099 [Clavulina sp. PMI_390]